MNVLVVEDNLETQEILTALLEGADHEVSVVDNGENVVEILNQKIFDIVLLDYLLPGKDGCDVLKDIRQHEKGKDLSVIMLTGVTEENDTLKAFDLGVDDYVTKPFLSKILLARMAAVERRKKRGEGNTFAVDDGLRVDLNDYQVFYFDVKVDLTLTEFKILKELLCAKGSVVSRDDLKVKTLNSNKASQRTVDVHVTSLRKKLKEYGDKIKTVRGVGYRFA